MKKYEVKKTKAKHIQACYEISPSGDCIKDKIDYLEEMKRGLKLGTFCFGGMSVIGSAIILANVKNFNNVEELASSIILVAGIAGLSFVCEHDLRVTRKKLTKLDKIKPRY